MTINTMEELYGRVHSFQSMGTLDGPGVRSVVFMQGCPLRCCYCHNPDTWETVGGALTGAGALFQRVRRYKGYFGARGGVTVSGGEPLLQAAFVRRFFSLCREDKIHTALDTSGCLLDGEARALLDLCDLVLLDLKFTTEEAYRAHTGGTLAATLRFLDELEKRKIPVWVRQVIAPGLNDDEENIGRLGRLISPYSCVEKVELLPFRRLCLEKYQAMGIPFPMGDTPEADPEMVARLQALVRLAK